MLVLPLPSSLQSMRAPYPNAAYSMLISSILLNTEELSILVLGLSIHMCIHEKKAFLLSCVSSLVLHFIWQPTDSALNPPEIQDSQVTSWSYTVQFALVPTNFTGNNFWYSKVYLWLALFSFSFPVDFVLTQKYSSLQWLISFTGLHLFAVSCQGSGRINKV